MAEPREIRRLAFQVVFQLDARPAGDTAGIRESLDGVDGVTDKDRDKAYQTGLAAFDARVEADKEFTALAPDWPVHRQAAADRAILRLAWYEMTSGKVAPKIVVNEAVELAKEFSTDKSPAFVNGLLDKVLKRVEAAPSAGQG
jgi:transcription antitermination protein NusB